MGKNLPVYDRYFLSYTGIKLPLKLTSPLERSEIENRNTYFGANFDTEDRLVPFIKWCMAWWIWNTNIATTRTVRCVRQIFSTPTIAKKKFAF